MSIQERNCKWHFDQQGGRDDGPNEPMQDNFKKTPYASLVRESIQNSLDVVSNHSQPLRMVYSFGKMRVKEYPNFFNLEKHIQGCLDYYNNNNDAKVVYQPMLDYLRSLSENDYLYFLKVSDYNTKGMNYVKGDTSNLFYSFVQAAGVSSKEDSTAGGSYGFGKAAYFYFSPLRTILVSTQTNNNRRFFEGITSLCTHTIKGRKKPCAAVGFYNNENREPVTKQSDIPTIFQRKEPGTDIFIMGIDVSDKEDICQEMIEAVLRNFWMAIESKKLEVKFNVSHENDIDINKKTLPELMAKYFLEEEDTRTVDRYYNPKPYWYAVHYEKTDTLHIKVIKETLPILGSVTLYVLKRRGVSDKVVYMRKPLMLVKGKRTFSNNGFYGVFVCDDRKGNEILRHMENSAHNEWDPSTWQENGKIVPLGKDAKTELDEFIIRAIESVFLKKSEGVQQILNLEDFLYIPTAAEDDEDDFEKELSNGKSQDGSSITSDISGKKQAPSIVKPATGKIMFSDPVDKPQKKDKKGGHLSGHGTQKKKNKGGGGLSPKRILGHYSDSEDGVQGSMLAEVPVRYRSFAQVESGRVVHIIVIHSDVEIPNGRIDLIIGGEQTDDVVAIKSCSIPGTIEANTISGIHIFKGKNLIKIVFADNMRHAIKLDAYELT